MQDQSPSELQREHILQHHNKLATVPELFHFTLPVHVVSPPLTMPPRHIPASIHVYLFSYVPVLFLQKLWLIFLSYCL